jgi:hypothetical protein
MHLLTSWGWEILPHPPHSPDYHRQTSICSQKWRRTSEVSTSTPMKMSKMKSRNVYVPKTFFLSEGIEKLRYSYGKWLHGLGDNVET